MLRRDHDLHHGFAVGNDITDKLLSGRVLGLAGLGRLDSDVDEIAPGRSTARRVEEQINHVDAKLGVSNHRLGVVAITTGLETIAVFGAGMGVRMGQEGYLGRGVQLMRKKNHRVQLFSGCYLLSTAYSILVDVMRTQEEVGLRTSMSSWKTTVFVENKTPEQLVDIITATMSSIAFVLHQKLF